MLLKSFEKLGQLWEKDGNKVPVMLPPKTTIR